MYKKERDNIIEALKGFEFEIEHIGSTSVVGLASKPIIDIQVGLKNESDLDEIVAPMEKAQFSWNRRYDADLKFRRYFMRMHLKGSDKPFTRRFYPSEIINVREYYDVSCHVHIVPFHHDWWDRHIRFRDWLRTHEDDREAYQNLKLELSERDWEKPNDYGLAKSALIRSIESKVYDESRSIG